MSTRILNVPSSVAIIEEDAEHVTCQMMTCIITDFENGDQKIRLNCPMH